MKEAIDKKVAKEFNFGLVSGFFRERFFLKILTASKDEKCGHSPKKDEEDGSENNFSDNIKDTVEAIFESGKANVKFCAIIIFKIIGVVFIFSKSGDFVFISVISDAVNFCQSKER